MKISPLVTSFMAFGCLLQQAEAGFRINRYGADTGLEFCDCEDDGGPPWTGEATYADCVAYGCDVLGGPPETYLPTFSPTMSPTERRYPTWNPTGSPTWSATTNPTGSPTASISLLGTVSSPDTDHPTSNPTNLPSSLLIDTAHPTSNPTSAPTLRPTPPPSPKPTRPPYYLTSPPTNKPKKPPGAKGDPHIMTWTGEWFDYMGQCDLKLVHAPQFDGKQDIDIHIRTKIESYYSYIEAAAVKIGEDVLEVKSHGEHLLNGERGHFRHGHKTVPTIGGYPVHHTKMDHKKLRFQFDIVLGKNTNITLDTLKDWVGVRIVNGDRASFGKVSGLMGSFDGGLLGRDGSDLHGHHAVLGQDWQVQPDEDMLFHKAKGPQSPDPCLLPGNNAKASRGLGEEVPKEVAEKACAHVEESAVGLCVHDVMATADLDVALVF